MGLFVDQYYSVEKFQAAYHGVIPHITDRNQWPEVDKGFKCHAPIIKEKRSQVGRGRKGTLDHLKLLVEELGRQNAKIVESMDTGVAVGDAH